MTRLINVPALFFEPPTVAVTIRQSMNSSWPAEEVVVSILKEPGGLPAARLYGTSEALGALASAIGEALDSLALVPLDEDHARQVDVVRDVMREPSDE